MTEKRNPAPAGHLPRSSTAFWRDILADYELEKQHLRILQAALEAWDRVTQAPETIAKEGATFHDRFGTPRKHPAIRIEENAQTPFLAPPPPFRAVASHRRFFQHAV